MQTTLFLAAAIASVLTFIVHAFAGRVFVVRPLLAQADLPPASKWLNYYCWHITTILIAAIAGAFVYVACNPERPELAVFVTLLACMCSVLSALVALRGRINPLRFPSTSLFALITALGISALCSSSVA